MMIREEEGHIFAWRENKQLTLHWLLRKIAVYLVYVYCLSCKPTNFYIQIHKNPALLYGNSFRVYRNFIQ